MQKPLGKRRKSEGVIDGQTDRPTVKQTWLLALQIKSSPAISPPMAPFANDADTNVEDQARASVLAEGDYKDMKDVINKE